MENITKSRGSNSSAEEGEQQLLLAAQVHDTVATVESLPQEISV